MREIKFRAWYKGDFDFGGFVPPKFIMDKVEGEYCRFVMERDPLVQYDMESIFCDDNWIAEQFTGLKDANGVEIYEGDIVELRAQWGGLVSPVIYQDGCFGFKDGCCVYTFQDASAESLRVTGNIHQNPELLEASE